MKDFFEALQDINLVENMPLCYLEFAIHEALISTRSISDFNQKAKYILALAIKNQDFSFRSQTLELEKINALKREEIAAEKERLEQRQTLVKHAESKRQLILEEEHTDFHQLQTVDVLKQEDITRQELVKQSTAFFHALTKDNEIFCTQQKAQEMQRAQTTLEKYHTLFLQQFKKDGRLLNTQKLKLMSDYSLKAHVDVFIESSLAEQNARDNLAKQIAAAQTHLKETENFNLLSQDDSSSPLEKKFKSISKTTDALRELITDLDKRGELLTSGEYPLFCELVKADFTRFFENTASFIDFFESHIYNLSDEANPEDIQPYIEPFKDCIKDLIHNAYDLVKLAEYADYLSEEQFQYVCESVLGQGDQLFTRLSDFTVLFEEDFYCPQKLEIITETFKNHLAALIDSADSFHEFFRCLNDKEKESFYRKIKDKISEFIHSAKDFNRIYSVLHKEQQQEIYPLIKSKTFEFIQSANDFYCVCSVITKEQQAEIYLLNKNKIPELIQSADDFEYIFKVINVQQREEIYPLIKTKLGSIIHNSTHFETIFDLLNEEQRLDIYPLIKRSIPRFIYTAWDFKRIYSVLNEKQCEETTRFIRKEKFDFLFQQSLESYEVILPYLKPEDYIYVKPNVKNLLHSVNDFYRTLFFLTEEQRKAFLQLLLKELSSEEIPEEICNIMKFFNLSATDFENPIKKDLSMAEWKALKIIQAHEAINTITNTIYSLLGTSRKTVTSNAIDDIFQAFFELESRVTSPAIKALILYRLGEECESFFYYLKDITGPILKLINSLESDRNATSQEKSQALWAIGKLCEYGLPVREIQRSINQLFVDVAEDSSITNPEENAYALRVLSKLCDNGFFPHSKEVHLNIKQLFIRFASNSNIHFTQITNALFAISTFCKYGFCIEEGIQEIIKKLVGLFAEYSNTTQTANGIILWAISTLTMKYPGEFDSCKESTKIIFHRALLKMHDIFSHITIAAGVLFDIDDQVDPSQHKDPSLIRDLTLVRDKSRPKRVRQSLIDPPFEKGLKKEFCLCGFFVDYYNAATKTVIEFDGIQHLEIKQQTKDSLRDSYLRFKGYRVLRATNKQELQQAIKLSWENAPSTLSRPSLFSAKKARDARVVRLHKEAPSPR